MTALRTLPLACPDCRARVELDGDRVVCVRGHAAGRVRHGFLDFTRPRAGIGARLVEFWDSSPEYYESARSANDDYGDEGHGSHRSFLDAIAALGGALVLDVGCGTGEFAAALAGRAPDAEYVGVDVALLPLVEARALGRPGSYLAADAERLPLAASAFDAVVSLYALEHFTQPRESLAEMTRVLRPGGVLGLVAPALDRPLGTIPSIRLGLVWNGRKLPSRHPLNVVAYAVNRGRFALRQARKQVRLALDGRYRSFELIERPLVLEGDWAPDLDAVHVVSGRSVVRELEALGLEVVETTAPTGRLPALGGSLEFRAVARKPEA